MGFSVFFGVLTQHYEISSIVDLCKAVLINFEKKINIEFFSIFVNIHKNQFFQPNSE